MAFIGLCGDAHTAPDQVVGPFETAEEAKAWAQRQPDQPARYAEVRTLSDPD